MKSIPEIDEQMTNIGVDLFRIRALIRIINFHMEDGCFDTISHQDITQLIHITQNNIEKVYNNFNELERTLGV